nr:MAG TPA: hypothetical protein [Caudoviricetes sp.]
MTLTKKRYWKFCKIIEKLTKRECNNSFFIIN